MMLKRVVIAIVFLLCAAAASAEELDNYRTVDLTVEEYASIVAMPELGQSFNIHSVQVNLSLFPKESDRQLVLNQDIIMQPDGSAGKEGNKLMLEWKDPRDDTLRYTVVSEVRTVNNLFKITRKIPFPQLDIYRQGPFGRDIDAYTQASQFIELSKPIKEMSAEIMQGETDFYSAVFAAADWVRDNINYTLDTLTEEAVQNSTWVLENRYGVCDEITVLFISLLRAANIPARFIAGQVYSEKDGFGNHGWAEVFFPGFGWVPFDVTFGQFGWIDPGHVMLNMEHDPSEPSVSYMWRTENTKIKINPLSVKTKVKSSSGEPDKYAEISVEPLRNKVAPGSHVPVKITLKNLADFYLPLSVAITKAPGLVEKNERPVLLEPYEEKSIFWTAIIPEQANPGYLYTTFIEARAVFAGTIGSNITFADENEYYSPEWAAITLKKLEPREKKEYIPDVGFSCAAQEEYYYRSDAADIKCTIENRGTTNFKPIRACLEADCRDIDLLISETKEVEWSMPLQYIDSSDFLASVESRNMVKYAYPGLRIVETPKITVADFEPKSIKYNKDANLTLLVATEEEAFDITMSIKYLGHSSFGKLSGLREMVVPFNSKSFRDGNLIVELEYYDEVGKAYAETYAFEMDVYEIPWPVRLVMWLESLLPFVSF
ncbi:MAG: transglutaminase-like domain-containing protein [Nanoarchaeota archaeon]|nr:transglutaminase-like domain-containing protein [Nanoarchaeota archaeon]